VNPVQRYLPSIQRYSWILLPVDIVGRRWRPLFSKRRTSSSFRPVFRYWPNCRDDGYIKPVSTAEGINMAAGCKQHHVGSTMLYVVKA